MENIEAYRCPTCSRVYSEKTVESFQAHVKKCGSKSFKCDACEKDFTSLASLRLHLKIYHTACYIFCCKTCGKEFKSKFSLNLHEQIHGDAKERGRFSCEKCHKTFAWKSSLRRHLQDHFTKDAEPYTCPCGQAFQKYSILYLHKQACQKGWKKLLKKAKTKMPVDREIDEYDHTCQFCGAGFHERQQLSDHVDTCDPFVKIEENGRRIPTESEVYTAKEKMAQMLAKYKGGSGRERRPKVDKTEKIIAQENKRTDGDEIPDTVLPESIEDKQNLNEKEVKEFENNSESVSIVKTDQVFEISEIKIEKHDNESQFVSRKRKRKPKLFTDYMTDFSAPKLKREFETVVRDKTSPKVNKKIVLRYVGKSGSVPGEMEGKNIQTISRPSQKSKTSVISTKSWKGPSSSSSIKTDTESIFTQYESSDRSSLEENRTVAYKESNKEMGDDRITEAQTLNEVEVDKTDSGSENTSKQMPPPKNHTVFKMKEFLRKRKYSIEDENSVIENDESEICALDKKPVKSVLTEAKSLTFLCTTEKCQQTFSRKSRLIDHKKEVHNEKLEYLCTECSKTFSTMRCLKSHYRMAHLHLYSVILAYKNTDMKFFGDLNKNYGIPICTKCGIELFDVKDHVCEKTVELSFFCPYCDTHLSTYCKIQEHIREAHPEKEHSVTLSTKYHNLRGKKVDESLLELEETSTKCEICEEVFESNELLKTHISSRHVSLPYCCGVCRQSYGRKSAITRHLLIHSKAFVCKCCSKSFFEKKQLIRHERVHSGERPFECDICGNRFCDQLGVKQHMQRVHVKVFTERYKDTKAAQRLVTTSQGCKQMSPPKNHTVFKMKEFLSKRKYSIEDENSVIENDESEVCALDKKPVKSVFTEAKSLTFLCTTEKCQQTFSRKSRLIDHKKEVHNEKLEYLCTECSKTFSTLQCLKSHYRMAHLHLYSVILAYKNTDMKLIGDQDKNYAIPLCTKCGIELFDVKDHVCEKTVELSFFCPYCDTRLSTYCKIQEHFREAHPEKEHSVTLSTKYHNLRGKKVDESLLELEETSTKCEICEEVFESNELLKTHISSTHASLPYCCGVCLHAYGRKSAIKRHLLVHTGKSFVCKFCSKGFYERNLLETHERVHSGERPFQCDICGNRYCDQKGVKKHMQKVHVRVFTERYKNTKAAQRLVTKSQGCICHVCGEIFSIPYVLEQHMESHKKTKAIQCSVCSEEFETSHQYKLHKKFGHQNCAPKLNKNDIRSQIVSVSNAADVKKTLLELKTIDETHPSGKPFQCAVCHKRFKKVKLLNQHILSMHIDNSIKSCVCNICNRGFPRRSMLNVHLRVHTNSRPYRCRLCHKTYRQLAHVRDHLRAHGKSILSCRLCSASFKTNSTLFNHLMIHCTIFPFTCPVEACKEKFKDISQLIQHGITCFATNDSTKPFVCKNCNQTFDESSEVILHLYLHENEGLFPCEGCGMKLNSYKDLYFHKIKYNHFTEAEMATSKQSFRNVYMPRNSVATVDWQFGEDLTNQYDFSEPSMDNDQDTVARYKDSNVIEEAYGNEAEELILIAEQLTNMATGADQYTEAVITDQIGGEQQYDHHLESDCEEQSGLTLTANNASDNLGYAAIVVNNESYEAKPSELFTREAEYGTTEKDTYQHVKNPETFPTVRDAKVVEDTRIESECVDTSVTAQSASISDHVYMTASFVNTDDQTIVEKHTTHQVNSVNYSTNVGSGMTEIVQPTQIQHTDASEINNSGLQEESDRASKAIDSVTNGQNDSVNDAEPNYKKNTMQAGHGNVVQENSSEIEDILESLNVCNIDMHGSASPHVKIVDTQGNEVTVCVINEEGEQVQITDRQEILKSILQTGKYEIQYNYRQIERVGGGETDITLFMQGSKEGIDTDNVKVTDVFVVSEMDDSVPTVKIEETKKKYTPNSEIATVEIEETSKKYARNSEIATVEMEETKKKHAPNSEIASVKIEETKKKHAPNIEIADKKVLTNLKKIKGEFVKSPADTLDIVDRGDLNFKVDLKYYEEKDEVRYPFKCQQCPLRLNSVKNLNQHLKTHLSNDKRKYQCSICEAGFNVPSSLRIHMRTHTGDKPYSCPKCSKTFRQQGHLQVHLRVHENYYPFQCRICKKRFNSNSNLTTHMGTQHEQQDPHAKVHTCEVCHATFSLKNQLRLHQIKHLSKTSQKTLFQVCNAQGNTNIDLEDEQMRNESKKSSNTNKASLICDICGCVSKNAYVAKIHRTRHDKGSNMKCTECDKTFSSEFLLKEHKRQSHSACIPCEVCGLMFKNKTSINTHLLRVHQRGVGKYKCQRCAQMFNLKHYFFKHVSGCMKDEVEKLFTTRPKSEPM